MTTTHQLPTTDLLGRTLGHVVDEFKSLVDTAVWSFDDEALDTRFAQAAAVKAAAEELMARLAGEMESRRHANRVGAASTRAHLMGRHRMSVGEAGRVTRAAKQRTDPTSAASRCGERR